MMTSVASYFARSQVHLHALPRRSCVSVNIKIRVDTAGTTTSYPKAGSRVSRTLDNLKILPIVAAKLSCKLFHLDGSGPAIHTGFDCPSLQTPAEKPGFLPLWVSTLAQTNGPRRANFKGASRRCASSRIAEQPRLPLCRTELW